MAGDADQPATRDSAADKALLIRYFERRDEVGADERALIEALPGRIRQFSPGDDIVKAEARAVDSCLILDGFAARVQYLSEGSRQLTAVHVPGDFVDLHSLLLKVMDHSVTALGACRVLLVPHEHLRQAMERHAHLTRLFWLSTVIDGAIQRTWITCLGRRSVIQHLGHLICELYLRLESVGLARDLTFDFPITQAELGDLLGLSTVHVNRKLQELRGTGTIVWERSRITILDFDRLSSIAQFDPTYLSLRKEPR